jgi:hypothetical protein
MLIPIPVSNCDYWRLIAIQPTKNPSGDLLRCQVNQVLFHIKNLELDFIEFPPVGATSFATWIQKTRTQVFNSAPWPDAC